jgi:hypothetical protein
MNKYPFLPSGLKILQFGGFLFIGKYESFVQMFMMQNSAQTGKEKIIMSIKLGGTGFIKIKLK